MTARASLHLLDELDHVVGCSLAHDVGDWDGNPIGQGICDCFADPVLVDVPMPVWRDGWLVRAVFVTTETA